MSKKFYVLFGKFSQIEPNLVKSKPSIKRYQDKYKDTDLETYTNAIDAEIALKTKQQKYEDTMREVKNILKEKAVKQKQQQSAKKEFTIKNCTLPPQMVAPSVLQKKEKVQLLDSILRQPAFKFFTPSALRYTAPFQVNLFFDGSCRGNPGPMGIGYEATYEGSTFFNKSQFAGHGTNNEAEFKALTWGMMDCVLKGIKRAEFYGDSQIIIQALKRRYTIRKPHLLQYTKVCFQMEKLFQWAGFHQVERQQNRRADKLAQQGSSKYAL